MKRFRVTVNGQPFEVTVEDTEGGAAPQQPARFPAAGTPAQAPRVAPAQPQYAQPAPTPAAAPAPAGAPGAVTAPLPGLIVAVKVQAGQAVTAGQVLLVLEAMKMENDVVAPVNGVVKDVLVQAGASVGAGQALVIVE